MRESQSALEIQQQELALAQRKLEENARMESLRLEEEAAVAVAKAQAIGKELSLEENQEPEPPDLPRDDPLERAQCYVNSQHFEEPNLGRHFSPDVSNRAINPQPHQVNASVQRTPYKEELNPTVKIFTPPTSKLSDRPQPKSYDRLHQLYGPPRANCQQDSEIRRHSEKLLRLERILREYDTRH